MIETTLTVTRPDLLGAYAEGLQKAPDFTAQVVEQTVNDVSDDVLADLRTEPGSVAYPIRWKSVRQRKAFFASNGFGGGIPYQRKAIGERMVDRWKLVVIYQSGSIPVVQLSNDSPIEQFVTGIYQQPFHAVTGWYQSSGMIQEAGMKLTDAIETDMIKVLYLVEDYAEAHAG